MIGPLLIHYTKTKKVYKAFFETLLGERPGLRLLHAYGTDGEMALIEALQESFPSALSLRTFRHFQRSVVDFLKRHGLQEFETQFTKEILVAIKLLGF